MRVKGSAFVMSKSNTNNYRIMLIKNPSHVSGNTFQLVLVSGFVWLIVSFLFPLIHFFFFLIPCFFFLFWFLERVSLRDSCLYLQLVTLIKCQWCRLVRKCSIRWAIASSALRQRVGVWSDYEMALAGSHTNIHTHTHARTHARTHTHTHVLCDDTFKRRLFPCAWNLLAST